MNNYSYVNLKPYFIVIFIGIFWGSTFALTRIAAESDMHPLGLTFWQALGGGCVLLILCAWRRKWLPINKVNLLRFFIIGLLGTAVPGSLYFYAASHVPSGILAITVALVPMLTYAASWVFRFDVFSLPRMLGIILGFAAMLLLVMPETSLPDRSMVGWVLIAFIPSLFYTTENIVIEKVIPQGTDMMALLMGGMFAAALMLAPVVWLQNAFEPLLPPFGAGEIAVIALMVITAISYFLFLYLITIAGAVFASMASYLITLSGVFWGMWVFSERHSLWVWAALALMMSGMLLVTPRNKQQGE